MAFEPFYKGTELINPVDVNYVYQFHKDIELYHLWKTEDEENFYNLYTAAKKAKSNSKLAALSNALKPIVESFEELDEEKQFEVRGK